MRKFALIGALLFLFIPFSYIQAEGPGYDVTQLLGFVYTSSEGDYLWIHNEGSETFSTSWFEDDGYYNNAFGDFWIIGVLALVGVILSAALAFIDRKTIRSAYLLLASGILVFVLRLLVLSDNDLSFYQKNDGFFGESMYLEIPLGPVFALIFTLLEIREK
ncbi:MAG: hypothetical protein INQ03_10335 [Candidatus Heimdallarchaeota archaeon]|nr:hypothetical protein [Candidatus Heimdallarchaeota archaeon]